MAQELTLTPEKYEIATAYLECGSDAVKTSEVLGIPISTVIDIIEDRHVSMYINSIYLDRGYRNKEKLGTLIDTVIEQKMEEALESGVYSTKDLLEWVKVAVLLRESETKMNAQRINNTQINIGDSGSNLSALIERLIPNGN